MVLRAAILALSIAYGVILLAGAGFITGGGHAALALVPLAMGPIGYLPARLSSVFHDPDSPLIAYAGAADTLISLVAVLGWPVAAGLAVWRAKRCFLLLMGLYYLSIAGSWVYIYFDSPRYLLKVDSGLHLIVVLIYVLIFICGQGSLWALHSGRLLSGAQPTAPPAGGPATEVGSSEIAEGPPSVS